MQWNLPCSCEIILLDFTGSRDAEPADRANAGKRNARKSDPRWLSVCLR